MSFALLSFRLTWVLLSLYCFLFQSFGMRMPAIFLFCSCVLETHNILSSTVSQLESDLSQNELCLTSHSYLTQMTFDVKLNCIVTVFVMFLHCRVAVHPVPCCCLWEENLRSRDFRCANISRSLYEFYIGELSSLCHVFLEKQHLFISRQNDDNLVK